jgi:hypothetical protein
MPGIIGSTGWERSSAWTWDLLVHAQHQRPLGRVQVQSHNVANLLDEQGVC